MNGFYIYTRRAQRGLTCAPGPFVSLYPESISPDKFPEAEGAVQKGRLRMKERTRIALLLAAVGLVYGNTLWNAFTLDDDLYISRNPQVTNFSLRQLFIPPHFAPVFRPVTIGTFALNWAVEGARPFGFHVVNILLQAVVVWLLYVLLRNILGTVSPQGKMVAFVAALLFAVHPIHTEAVASIAGRSELLAAGFLIAACILHLSDREMPALGCFVLAVLSKESAVVFLPLVLVCDYANGIWKSLARYTRIAGVTVLYLGVLWKIQGGRFGQGGVARLDNPLADLPAGWRILNALRVAWKYVALQIYPRALSSDYSFNQIPVYMDWRHTLPAAAAELAVFAAWIWAIRKGRSGLVLAGGLYLAGFATTSNILRPIGTIMGERLAYLPSAGFCLLVAMGWVWLLGYVERNNRQRVLTFGLLATMLLGLSIRTIARNRDWKDDRTLIASDVIVSSNSAKMHFAKAGKYMDEGELDLARVEIQTAVLIYPDYPDALATQGVLESKFGHYQAAGAMMEKALLSSDRTNINYDYMAVNLASLYIQTDHLDGAMELLNREIAESPKYARAWANRAVVHYKRGEAAPARSDAEAALRLDPDNKQAQNVMQRLNTGSSPGSPQ
jgi:tetratricopeptide (TPR) repeat protein